MERYLRFGAAGELNVSALPSCARSNVAFHLFVGRSCPSPREGLKTDRCRLYRLTVYRRIIQLNLDSLVQPPESGLGTFIGDGQKALNAFCSDDVGMSFTGLTLRQRRQFCL